MCVDLWKKKFSAFLNIFRIQAQASKIIFLEFKHKQKKNEGDFIRPRFKVQLTYDLICLSNIFSTVPLLSMILSRLSSSHTVEHLDVQKNARILEE